MIELRPMTEEELRAYLTDAIAQYGAEHVRAGNWSAEDAPRLAQKTYDDLLPDGVATENQYLYSIIAPDEPQPAGMPAGMPVGMVWLNVTERGGRQQGYIYDIKVDAAFRRRGYASAALQAVEDRARELGAATIALHVFGHNTAARALYEKLGFTITNLMMAKDL